MRLLRSLWWAFTGHLPSDFDTLRNRLGVVQGTRQVDAWFLVRQLPCGCRRRFGPLLWCSKHSGLRKILPPPYGEATD